MEKLEAAPKKQFFKDCTLTKRKWEGNPGGRNNRNKNIRGGETKMPMAGWGWGGWKSTNACRVPSTVVYTGEKKGCGNRYDHNYNELLLCAKRKAKHFINIIQFSHPI